MGSKRALMPLVAAVAAVCLIMLGATLMAHASPMGRTRLWRTPENVSDPAGTDGDTEVSPDIGVDSAGNIHLVWAQGHPEYGYPDGKRRPYYTYSTDGGNSWSSPDDQVATLGSYDTTLVASQANTVHAAWCEYKLAPLTTWVYYSLISGGSWGSKQPVLANSGDNVASPSLALAKGYVHVVWSQQPQGSDQDLYYSSKTVSGGGEWSTPVIVVDTDKNSSVPSLAADNYGDLHLVWQEDIEDLAGGDQIHYISGTIGVGSVAWSSPISVSKSVTQATTPDIVIGGDDIVHVAFGQRISNDEQYVWYRNFPNTDPDLGVPSKIPGSRVGISHVPPYYTQPSIGLEGTDDVHILWNGQMSGDAADLIYHVLSRDQGASWLTPVAISEDDGHPDRYPTLTIRGQGGVHAAWQQYTKPISPDPEDKDIYYSSYNPGAFLPLGVKNYP